MRLLVCGDRNWTDKDLIEKEILALPNVEVIIEGEQRGADTLARQVAEEFDIPIDPYVAEWTRLGKAAGPLRNREMIVKGKPTFILAFHDDISTSKGTRDLLKQADSFHIPYKLVSHTGENHEKNRNKSWNTSTKQP